MKIISRNVQGAKKQQLKAKISLLKWTYKPNMERVSQFDRRAGFLQKLIENVQHCGKL